MTKQELNDQINEFKDQYIDIFYKNTDKDQIKICLKILVKDVFLITQEYITSFDEHIGRNSDEYLGMYRQRCDREWLFWGDMEHTEEFEESQQNIYFYN